MLPIIPNLSRLRSESRHSVGNPVLNRTMTKSWQSAPALKVPILRSGRKCSPSYFPPFSLQKLFRAPPFPTKWPYAVARNCIFHVAPCYARCALSVPYRFQRARDQGDFVFHAPQSRRPAGDAESLVAPVDDQ
jgi:hypothetical protein